MTGPGKCCFRAAWNLSKKAAIQLFQMKEGGDFHRDNVEKAREIIAKYIHHDRATVFRLRRHSERDKHYVAIKLHKDGHFVYFDEHRYFIGKLGCYKIA